MGEALNLLAFSSKKAAEIMKKVLESAVANAEHNEGADVDDLKVSPSSLCSALAAADSSTFFADLGGFLPANR